MKKIKFLSSGQSLIEAVFAIGILVMIASAILALVSASISGQQESESQIIANNLAREGIEAARNIRDSNWLSNQDWDTGLIDSIGNSQRAVAWFNPDNGLASWSFDFNLTPGKDLLFLSSAGVYSHLAQGNKPTNFSRQVIFENICRNDATGQERITFPCAGGETKIGLKVSSQVSWHDQVNRPRQVTLQDLFYDWK